MSLEALNDLVQQMSERKTLSLEIPSSEPSSSVPSSGPPSPNPLADSDTLTPLTIPSETPSASTSTHTSTSSLPTATPSVKFAPLPELAPRKRRSTVPLGMAARSQLMRKRKGHYDAQQQQQQLEQQQQRQMDGPVWTPGEIDAQRLKQEEMATHYALLQASAAALAAREEEAQLKEEEEEMERHHVQKLEREKLKLERARVRVSEDADVPLSALGKTVKTFWRKVAYKDSETESEEVKTEERGRHNERETAKEGVVSGKRRKSLSGRHSGSSSPATSTPPPLPLPPLRPILANITPSNVDVNIDDTPIEPPQEGGVWEEAVSDEFPLNVSQTETVIEGRPMYSLAETTVTVTTTTAKVEAVAKKPTNKVEGSRKASVLVKSAKSPPVKSKSLGNAKS